MPTAHFQSKDKTEFSLTQAVTSSTINSFFFHCHFHTEYKLPSTIAKKKNQSRLQNDKRNKLASLEATQDRNYDESVTGVKCRLELKSHPTHAQTLSQRLALNSHENYLKFLFLTPSAAHSSSTI